MSVLVIIILRYHPISSFHCFAFKIQSPHLQLQAKSLATVCLTLWEGIAPAERATLYPYPAWPHLACNWLLELSPLTCHTLALPCYLLLSSLLF